MTAAQGRTAGEAWGGQLVDDEDQALAPELVTSTEDFDAFWAAYCDGQPTATVRGVRITVPHDVPLAFLEDYERAQASSDRATIERLLGHLFGADTLAQWSAAGIGMIELQIVLAWGMANAAGKRVSFSEAAELVAKARAADAARGKAPGNRVERRQGKKKRRR